VESVWCGGVVLSKLWSFDGIACDGDSSTHNNSNYQWICESRLAHILAESQPAVQDIQLHWPYFQYQNKLRLHFVKVLDCLVIGSDLHSEPASTFPVHLP
jgi:hypothetical protein